MPQHIYDALVSFSFNVGTGAACRSRLVSYIKRHWVGGRRATSSPAGFMRNGLTQRAGVAACVSVLIV